MPIALYALIQKFIIIHKALWHTISILDITFTYDGIIGDNRQLINTISSGKRIVALMRYIDTFIVYIC